ncbi:MAG: NUDIX hydrolase [Alphaproteobacteria bacterium]|nr:NUDIX hydrolase [Alphaproteobacteria bacterium]
MSDTWDEGGNPWIVKGMAHAFENDWFRIDEHDVIRPDGAKGYYGVIRVRRLAVGVLPIDAEGCVHLVGQWRFPLARYSWEIPEGGAEPGEDARGCAERELAEETGLRARQWVQVLEMDLSNSLTDEQAVIFIATDLSPGEADPDPTEVLQRRKAHFLKVLDRVAAGHIRDSLTVAAVLRAHHMAVTGQLPAALTAAMLRQGE